MISFVHCITESHVDIQKLQFFEQHKA